MLYRKVFLAEIELPAYRQAGIHNNPIVGKWRLAKLPEEYFHSSTPFYMLNQEHKFVKLTHWRDVGAHEEKQ
jgi:hypothetical protein